MVDNTSRPVNMGLQLFPPPPKKAKPAKKQRISVQSPPQSVVERAESPYGDGSQEIGGRLTPQGGRQTPQYERSTPSPITLPPAIHPAADIPRSHTSFSEAPTLVRSHSSSSHSSQRYGNSPPRSESVMHSIFPRYNPEVPLEHQPYFPTQTSPTHIPRTVINRRPYSPSLADEGERGLLGLQSPAPVGISPGRFPRGVQDETIMEPSSNEEMKELWKVTNGWRVSASEGRSFCMKMTSAAEEPIHTLSSATQPFLTMKLIPTSTSAQMTVTRQDPSKSVKDSSPRLGISKTSIAMEVMSTTLEESARRLPPNDGLVALLYPRAASQMVIELANKPNRQDQESIRQAAERECGRLVWDEDSKRYYLVHPAIATPFRVSIHSTAAWSRVEYTLEHPELPRNLVRLTRDGAGSGFLEVDTAVAAKIDCFYIVDVAICAIMLVALAEEKTRNVEHFDAPPSSAPTTPSARKSKRESWIGKKGKEVKMEEFELDLESQDSVKEQPKKEKEEKIPGFFGLIWMLIKCVVWTITMFFKGLAKCIVFVSRCLMKKK